MEVYQIPVKKKRRVLSRFSLTTNLIILNVLIFVVLTILFREQLFIQDGFVAENIALSLNNIKEFRLWTFLTSMFMHGGFFHLFVNMLSLFFIGGLIEKLLGRKRYIWFYILSGLFAGGLFILTELVDPSLPAVGASGALFGLVGLLMILTPNLRVYAMFIPIPIKMKYAAPGLLIVLWLISLVGKISIGNFAHLGGFVVGLIYGFYLRKKFPKKTKYLSEHFS